MKGEHTRSLLEKALEGTRPDAARLATRSSEMMARAAERRAAAAGTHVLGALAPLTLRLVPPLGAAAALLALAAGVSWWQSAASATSDEPSQPASVSSALLAGYETDADSDPLAAALLGDAS